MSWDVARLPDQTGKTILITGANAGLGYFASEQLARAGAHIVLACRNEERGTAALRALRGRVAGASAELVVVDVSDLAGVRVAAGELAERSGIDVVIANAGITGPPRKRTVTGEGNELVLATNVLGHFLLTALLLPTLERASAGRLVTMGSQATRLINFQPDNLQLQHGYSSWRAYAQSKIALESFGFELDRRLRARNSSVSSVVAHPGYAVGGLAPRIQGVNDPSAGTRFADHLQRAIGAQGKNSGAWSAVRAAIDPDAVGGQYWGPRAKVRGLPTLQTPARVCVDPAVAQKVWEHLEDYSSESLFS